jgi:glycosyltransferase involved in cell wall biosynthesis
MNDEFSNSTREVRENQMPTKPRVLFVVGFLGGGEGIASHLITLSRGLIKYGWEVALAAPMAEEPQVNEKILCGPKYYESHGINYFVVPLPKFRLSLNYVASGMESLLKLNVVISQFKPDIIHVHSLSMCPYIKVMQFLHKIPFVSSCHAEPTKNRIDLKLGAFANQFINNTFFGNRVIPISSELESILKNIVKIPQRNIRLICYGIDNDYFRPPSPEECLKARQAFELASDSKVICLIGRLNPIKGHDVLFRALSILKSQGIEAIALCAGRGTEKEEEAIDAHIVETGVSDLVRLVGFADPRQVLWASDVIALPSRQEGFGLVIAEAMLCGVVSVRTPAAGAFDQIEDGINGFIVPFDAPDFLALRLQQLLENDNLRVQMSAAALGSAQLKFTADRMTKDTIAVYEEVINEGVAGKNV